MPASTSQPSPRPLTQMHLSARALVDAVFDPDRRRLRENVVVAVLVSMFLPPALFISYPGPWTGLATMALVPALVALGFAVANRECPQPATKLAAAGLGLLALLTGFDAANAALLNHTQELKLASQLAMAGVGVYVSWRAFVIHRDSEPAVAS